MASVLRLRSEPFHAKRSLRQALLTAFALTVTTEATAVPPPFLAEELYDVDFNDAAAADFDRDGWVDVVLAEPFGISIWRNNSAGALYSWRRIAIGANPSSVAVGDLDGDGWQDIVFVSGEQVRVIMARKAELAPPELLPRPDATCATDRRRSGWPGFEQIAVADVNGDGQLDLVQLTCRIVTYLGRSGGKFGPPKVSETDVFPSSGLELADLNRDGQLDVVVGVGKTSILSGLGDGRFGGRVTLLDYWGAAAAADFDEDGWTDLAVNLGSVILWNDRSGGFGFPERDTLARWRAPLVPESSHLGSGVMAEAYDHYVIASDFDGDGRIDILAGPQSNTGSQRVEWFLNRGGRRFDPAPPPDLYRPEAAWGSYPDYLIVKATADLDGDGAQDLVSWRWTPSYLNRSRLGVLRHSHPEAFNGMVELPLPTIEDDHWPPRKLFPVTLDGDGGIEMLQPTATHLVHWTVVEGGYLRQPKLIQVEGTLVEVAELDGDGRTDLLLARGQG